jgi:hypothetical protein
LEAISKEIKMKTILASIGFLVLSASCAHQTTAASDPQMEKMAQMHSDMAACLRSDKSVDECHSQMMASCQKDGSKSCAMMKEHKHEGRMGMMRQPEAEKPKPPASKDDEHARHHPEKNK